MTAAHPKLSPLIPRILVVLTLAALTGCASLDSAAPPVSVLSAAADPSVLATGRALYTGRCAKCHAVEPIHDYSASDWARIIPDMAERTKLTPAETAALTAYVKAALTIRPAG
jgi:mono/diheme cytochrome c family protein